ncbi:MAG TPA: PDZ domain-containing protein, partial [Pyrinomonadaceae bacterium]|nr:PDZ domain-containing protein [Pyrinomonadaceae bacterium]
MKRSVFTTGTWLVLAGAALLVTAGILNFGQRLKHDTPPWDGVTWSDTRLGVVAEIVEPGSSGARAQIFPGDHLLAISLNNSRYEEVGRADRVPVYLEQAHVGGNIH